MGLASMQENEEITRLLNLWKKGDLAAGDRLFALIYRELYKRAKSYMKYERAGHTLSATALVNEIYVELAGSLKKSYKDREHFFAAAARAMRHRLKKYARDRKALKRGGNEETLNPVDISEIPEPFPLESLAPFYEALDVLAKQDPQKARMVEMRIFLGMKIDEIVEVMGLSTATVNRYLSFSLAWLRGYLKWR